MYIIIYYTIHKQYIYYSYTQMCCELIYRKCTDRVMVFVDLYNKKKIVFF